MRLRALAPAFRSYSDGVKKKIIYESILNKNYSPLQAYQQLLKEKQIKPDDRQERTVHKLTMLYDDIKTHKEEIDRPLASTGSSWLKSLFRSKDDTSSFMSGKKSSNGASPVRGLYMYGGVGCGKTFLMDMLYHLAPVQSKHRVHFHTFIQQVHNRLHAYRTQNKALGGNKAIELVACDMIKEGGKLCFFDELAVTDIADAMMLRQLFSAMVDQGAIFVITSNRKPDDLYKNGLQRELFVPCIELLKTQCYVHDMVSKTDFRLLNTHECDTFYIKNGIPEEQTCADAFLDSVFSDLTMGFSASECMLLVNNRKLHVSKAAHGVAEFTFNELCNQPLGAADFLGLARAFHTVILKDIPELNAQRLNEVRRFITLIDVLYDQRVKLICSSARPPEQIFVRDSESVHFQDEIFAFDRTVSRLQDMQSKEYKIKPHKPNISPTAAAAAAAIGVKSSDLTTALSAPVLTDDEINMLWEKYDTNKDGYLEKSEIEAILSDIYDCKAGHREILPSTLNATMGLLQANSQGLVTRDSFKTFYLHATLWYL